MVFMMIMDLLSGAMVIKNARPRKKELKFIAWHL